MAAGWVVVPLVARRFALLNDGDPTGMVDADARRRVALASLKEVEYDRVSGKLDDQDYHRLKAQLEREALAAIAVADAPSAISAADAFAGDAPAGPGPAHLPITHACGFVNPPGSRFCSGCGRRLG
jgi:hypothetical protein